MAKTLLQDNVVDEVTIAPIIRPTINAGATGSGDVFAIADTEVFCAPNSVVKYVNIRMESMIRDVAPEAPGMLEYAIVCFEEAKVLPIVDAALTAGIGLTTLGVMCKHLYRGNCIWEGARRISRELPEVIDLHIKLPPKFCANKIGKYLMLLKSFRTADVSDTTTDCRTWLSHMYKCYT